MLRKNKILLNVSDAAVTQKFDQGQQKWHKNVKLIVGYYHIMFETSLLK